MRRIIFLRDAQIGNVIYAAGQSAEVSELMAMALISSGAARAAEKPGPKEFKQKGAAHE